MQIKKFPKVDVVATKLNSRQYTHRIRSIIKPCNLKLFQVTYRLHKIGYWTTVYPRKYAHGFCFAVLCCGYTLFDFPISIRLTSLALWQSNDCPSAIKATLMNMDKYFINERLHNHNKAKQNKTVCIFLWTYCTCYCVCHYTPRIAL